MIITRDKSTGNVKYSIDKQSVKQKEINFTAANRLQPLPYRPKQVVPSKYELNMIDQITHLILQCTERLHVPGYTIVYMPETLQRDALEFVIDTTYSG